MFLNKEEKKKLNGPRRIERVRHFTTYMATIESSECMPNERAKEQENNMNYTGGEKQKQSSNKMNFNGIRMNARHINIITFIRYFRLTLLYRITNKKFAAFTAIHGRWIHIWCASQPNFVRPV